MRRTTAAVVAVVVAVSSIAGGSVFATSQSAGHTAAIDPTPSGPSESDSTHAVRMSVGSTAVAGQVWQDVVVDYSVDAPSADVSNVGKTTIERVGIDRGDDDPGTQIDVSATVDSASGFRDGKAVQITLAGDLTIQAGDEVVVVMRPVQNPQNAGTASVDVTVNSEGSAVTATASVTYEQHDASTTFADQSTTGETVVVDSVTFSEGGFVAIQNDSGANPSEIRGVSEYLPPGTHTDVTVELDTPIDADTTLVAQPYTDSNADRSFDFQSSSGARDEIYRSGDDNPIGGDQAEVTHTEGTPTPTDTPTESPPDDSTPTDTPTDTPTESPPDDSTPTDTPTDTPTESPPGDSTPTTTPAPGSGFEYNPNPGPGIWRSPIQPIPEYTFTVEEDLRVAFDASPSTVPGGASVTYRWDVDFDGTYELTGQQVTNQFDEPGIYLVRLRVESGQGGHETVLRWVYVSGEE